ncbi:MAG: hypothetical protein ACKVX9_15360 [Blastocatellia bacterium]
MAKRLQVGGMRETFIQLSASSVKGMEIAVRAIVKAGGRVLYAVPPKALVASLPEGGEKELTGAYGIVMATSGPIARRAIADSAHRVWNEHLSLDRRLRSIEAAKYSRGWDNPGSKSLHPPKEIQAHLRGREAAGPITAFGGPRIMTIPVLAGRIAVGVILVDSNEPALQITDEEETKVISEITEGLNMLSGFEPRAGIEWFFDFKRPKLSVPLSDFPGGAPETWEDLWRNPAMEAFGFSASLQGMNDYINALRNQFTAEWAYAIYVTKYPKTWYAYHWGNHLVTDFQADVWGIDNLNLIVAHETAHIFGCPDEYPSSQCNCTDLFGRFQIPNGNCDNCAATGVACLMKANTPSVCDYTRGHLGWTELAVLRKGAFNLKKMRTFDFETGLLNPDSGADILWEHIGDVTRLLVPQNGAMLANLGLADFDVVSHQRLSSLSYLATPIEGSDNSSNALPTGAVVGVRTNSGRFAKLKIKSYGPTLGLEYVTYQ